MRQKWGDFAKFWYVREKRGKCDRLGFRDEYFHDREERWVPYEFFDRSSMDVVGTNQPNGGEWGQDSSWSRRSYSVKHCGKRSCFPCQRPRMRRWQKKITDRTSQEGRNLYFVTPTLPGIDHGRESWNNSLDSAYAELQDWWHLSRVKVAVGRKRQKPFVASTSDCVRVFEVPQNNEGTWNPHAHVLVASDRSKSTVRKHWGEIWSRQINGETVKPRIQVKRANNLDELADYVTKVTRYITKSTSTDYAESGNRAIDDVLYRKHNVSFCGSWRYANTQEPE